MCEHVLALQEQHPSAAVEVWAQDEARLGLIPIVRKVWALRGKRPYALGRRRYQWVYLFGFVQPNTGTVEWILFPTVNTDVFQAALNHFAATVGAGMHKQIILVVDGAGWHRGKKLNIPEGIHLEFLPPYSPEVQPAEHLWPLFNDVLANRPIDTLQDLEAILVERCCYLAQQSERIRSTTCFHWWPNSESCQHRIN